MKKIVMSFAALAFVSFATAVAAGEFPDISYQELKTAIDAGNVTLLDANGSEKYSKSHIPTAIDFKANKDKLADLLPKDKKALVVAYCANPRCSAYQGAAKAAQELGYKNVKHFSAGIQGWEKAAGKGAKAE